MPESRTTTVNPSLILAGTAGISITGNALTATTATTAGTISGAIAEGQVTSLVADLAAKAPLIAPGFTGPATITGVGHLYANKTLRVLDDLLVSALTVTADGRLYVGVDTGSNAKLNVTKPATGFGSGMLAILTDLSVTGNPELRIGGLADTIGIWIAGASGTLAFGNTGLNGAQLTIDTATGIVTIPASMVSPTYSGSAAASGTLTLRSTSSATKGAVNLDATSLVFLVASSTTADQIPARITPAWATSTHASRKGRLALLAADFSGTDREGVRIESDGTQALVGFYGATAVAKGTITGSRGGNAALASLLTYLASLGLIIDSTS